MLRSATAEAVCANSGSSSGTGSLSSGTSLVVHPVCDGRQQGGGANGGRGEKEAETAVSDACLTVSNAGVGHGRTMASPSSYSDCMWDMCVS